MNTNRRFSTNRNAIVRTRTDRTGKLRTETFGRDSDIDVAATTDTRNNSTRVYIDFAGRNQGSFVALDGRQARTLYRVLAKHFDAAGKSTFA